MDVNFQWMLISMDVNFQWMLISMDVNFQWMLIFNGCLDCIPSLCGTNGEPV